MAWIVLNVSLSLSAGSMPREGGAVTATVTVTGRTDEAEEVNEYTASIRDDYVIPDILWSSGLQTAGPGEQLSRTHSVELVCDGKGHVAGPHGSSGERRAELYAYVIGGGLEGASDETPLRCLS